MGNVCKRVRYYSCTSPQYHVQMLFWQGFSQLPTAEAFWQDTIADNTQYGKDAQRNPFYIRVTALRSLLPLNVISTSPVLTQMSHLPPQSASVPLMSQAPVAYLDLQFLLYTGPYGRRHLRLEIYYTQDVCNRRWVMQSNFLQFPLTLPPWPWQRCHSSMTHPSSQYQLHFHTTTPSNIKNHRQADLHKKQKD